MLYRFLDLRLHVKFVVLCPEFLGDRARVFTLIEVSTGEADGKRLDGPRTKPRHQRHHDGGIDTSAQECSEGNVAEQANTNGFGHAMLELFKAFLFRWRLISSISRQIPIFSNPHVSVREFEKVPGRQLFDVLEGGMRIWDVTKMEKAQQPPRSNFGKGRCSGWDGLDFRTEQQPRAVHR